MLSTSEYQVLFVSSWTSNLEVPDLEATLESLAHDVFGHNKLWVHSLSETSADCVQQAIPIDESQLCPFPRAPSPCSDPAADLSS